jgi:hypothetical protein
MIRDFAVCLTRDISPSSLKPPLSLALNIICMEYYLTQYIRLQESAMNGDRDDDDGIHQRGTGLVFDMGAGSR